MVNWRPMPNRNRTWLNVVLGAAVLAGYLACVAPFRDQINDDAFITFRYAKFLADGRGPYFNDGEHVEGYTNFLMVPLMAAVIAVAGEDAVLNAARALGVMAGAAAVLGAWYLCWTRLRRMDGLERSASLLAWAAAALVATNSAFAVNSTTGLETTMFAAWITLGLVLTDLGHERARWRGAGVAFALAALTRPEGAIVFAVAAAGEIACSEFRRGPGRRMLLADAAIVGCVVAGHVAFRWLAYDGHWLPNTFYAKTSGMGGHTPAGYLAGYARDHSLYGAWAAALLPMVLCAPPQRRLYVVPTAVAAYGTLAVFATGPDWMLGYRLLAPFLPVWAALAVCGTAAALARLGVRRPAATGVVLLAVVVALFAGQIDTTHDYHLVSSVRAVGYEGGHLALAEWLRTTADPGDTVAMMDIGQVGYRCDHLRILDITGLTDRFIARSPGRFLEKEFDPAYVFDQRPRFLVIIMTAPLLSNGTDDVDGLYVWTPIESRLVGAEAFRRYYFRPRPVDDGDPLLHQLACKLGAERVFRHLYPRFTYLLAVYTRRE